MITVHTPSPIQQPTIALLFSSDNIVVGYCYGVMLKQSAWRPGLLFGYNLASKINPDCNKLHPQTVRRCKAAACAFRDGEVHDIFITCRIKNGGMKMASFMKHYLIEERVPSDRIHIIDPGFNTNTFKEIQVFLEVLKHLKLPEGCRTEIIAHSSWYHTKRIRMMFQNFGTNLYDLRNTNKGSLWDILSEAAKILFFWVIPGVNRHLGDIKLPDWVTAPVSEEGSPPIQVTDRSAPAPGT